MLDFYIYNYSAFHGDYVIFHKDLTIHYCYENNKGKLLDNIVRARKVIEGAQQMEDTPENIEKICRFAMLCVLSRGEDDVYRRIFEPIVSKHQTTDSTTHIERENTEKMKKEQNKTVKASDLKKLYDIACDTWKPKIAALVTNPWAEEVEVSGEMIAEMRDACTFTQVPVFTSIFGCRRTDRNPMRKLTNEEIAKVNEFLRSWTGKPSGESDRIAVRCNNNPLTSRRAIFVGRDYNVKVETDTLGHHTVWIEEKE